MATSTPNSFFPEQGNALEVAERSEPDPVYLSQDSEPEKKDNEAFTSGTPGFALDLLPIPGHLRNTYRFSNDPEIRKQEIETFLMLDRVAEKAEKEDRKCSPPRSCSSSSDSEVQTPVPKKPKLNLKISEKTKTVRRVGRNMEYGIHNHKKSKKVEQLWNYVEQTLVKNLVIEVLPLPQLKSTFLKPNIMTMEKVTDSSVKGVLQKFNTPQTKQTMLSDIQTENLGSLTFRRLIVRKRLAPGKYTFAVLPNMVMSSDQKVFYFAPDSVWYEKITTNNRSKEMTIPKPFQGNQSVDVLFQNTFSWDV